MAPCPICCNQFATKNYLTTHVETVHEGKTPYKCSTCHKSFKQNGTMSRHIKAVHERKKLFQCDVCSAYFFRKWGNGKAC